MFLQVEYARNQVGSRVLDNLMKFVSLESIERLINAFSPELRPMCSDRFSSHVLQRLMQTCTIRGNDTDSSATKSIKDVDRKKYNELALKLCRYVINNFEEFIDDTYANHVLRTAFECLGGIANVENEASKKKTTKISDKKLQVSSEFKELLSKSSERIRNWPRLVELVTITFQLFSTFFLFQICRVWQRRIHFWAGSINSQFTEKR